MVHETLSQKKLNTHKKRAGQVAQVVEHQHSKCKALSSNSSTTKTNKQQKKGIGFTTPKVY
jgi:hypothetical protein